MLPFYESHRDQITLKYGECYSFPAHLHREAELYYVLEGTQRMMISDKTYTLNKGETALVFPNEIHSYLDADTAKHLLIIFNPQLFPDFMPIFINYRPQNPVISADTIKSSPSDTIWTLNAISDFCANAYIPDIKLLKGYLTILFYRLMEMMPPISAHHTGVQTPIENVLSHIALHHTEPLSLTSVSQALGYSISDISRIFSNRIHTSFNDYVNLLRLESAVPLLTGTDKSMTDIAYEVGFESIRTFYRAFSKRFGTTPLRYRRQNSPCLGDKQISAISTGGKTDMQ